MGFELPNGKTARNLQEQVKFLSEKLKDLYAVVNEIGIKVLVVDELPEEGKPLTIYFVPAEDASQENIYNEYMWIEEEWELIGSTAIDLSDYMTLSTNQTVSGEKTFSNGLKIGSDMLLSCSSDFNGLEIGNDKNLVLNGIIYPKFPSQNDIGTSSYKWKDLYLSGALNIISTNTNTASFRVNPENYLTAQFEWNNTKVFYYNGDGIRVNKRLWPDANNSTDLGAPTNAWKDLYLSGNINLKNPNYSGTHSQIFESQYGRLFFKTDGSNAMEIQSANIVFSRSLIGNNLDLGNDNYKWRDLYLSRNLTDGANSVSVADLAALITYAKGQGWIS